MYVSTAVPINRNRIYTIDGYLSFSEHDSILCGGYCPVSVNPLAKASQRYLINPRGERSRWDLNIKFAANRYAAVSQSCICFVSATLLPTTPQKVFKGLLHKQYPRPDLFLFVIGLPTSARFTAVDSRCNVLRRRQSVKGSGYTMPYEIPSV